MVHALSNSGYSVTCEIVTIHMFLLLNLVSRYCIQKYTGSNTSSGLIEIMNLALMQIDILVA